MAFVNLEDPQGVVKLVIFPNTWKRVSEIIKYDQVVIVEGKMDNERGEPKILVNDIKTEMKFSISDTIAKQKLQPSPTSTQVGIGEFKSEYSSEEYYPPEPDLFPEGWGEFKEDAIEKNNVPVSEENLISNQPPQVGVDSGEGGGENIDEPIPQTDPVYAETSASEVENDQQVSLNIPGEVISASVMVEEEIEKRYILPTPPHKETSIDSAFLGEQQMITVVLRAMGDKPRDILRMRRIYGLLISYPGNDRFAFYVIEKDRGYRFEFPNDTTSFSDELQARLEDLVGAGNVIVEPITYQ